jgi:hypothetical protein
VSVFRDDWRGRVVVHAELEDMLVGTHVLGESLVTGVHTRQFSLNATVFALLLVVFGLR